MQGTLSAVLRAIIRRVVVMVMAIVVVVTIMIMVVVMAMVVVVAMVNTVRIAIPVRMKEEVREDTGRRPIGHADHRRQRKHEHHRPNEGNAASARSFQSRQHPFRHRPSRDPCAPFGATGYGDKTVSLSRDARNLEANAEAPSPFLRRRLRRERHPP
jgi:hypothetical protein